MSTDLLEDLQDRWWDDSEYAVSTYVGPPPSDDLIASVEQELGVRLPASYVALMRRHNGGTPRYSDHPAPTRTTWSDDHVAIHGIHGIGRELAHSVCGSLGSRFWVDEWGYPDVGVYVADCPSAGHDMVALDYRTCGRTGEPRVVHVDQERDYAVTVLAPTFATFIRGLCTWPDHGE